MHLYLYLNPKSLSGWRHYRCQICLACISWLQGNFGQATAGLQDAYDGMIQMFIYCEEAFPVDQVLGPACAQMANHQDNAKLACKADPLLCASVCTMSAVLLAMLEP